MFEGLDRIDWASINHAYGSAEDVPELLRHLVSSDPEEREMALGGMYGAVHHQGDIYDCTIASIPFLLEAVANPKVPDRGGILGLLASIGGADTPSLDYHPDDGDDAESDDRTLGFQNPRIAHEAVLAEYNTYLALLTDPDPAVRQKIPEVLSACWEQARRIIPALQDRLISETDQQSRIQLIEAIGALADRAAKGQTGRVDIDGVSAWLVERVATDADPAVRLSALVQIARTFPAQLPSNVVATVLDILQASFGDAPSPADSEGVDQEAPSVPIMKTHIGMLRQLSIMVNEGRYAPWMGDSLHQLHSAMGDRVLERLHLITALLRAPQWEWRVDGARSAGVLIGGWRGPYAEFVALLGEQLADPNPRVREAALSAFTFPDLGRLAAPAADALARYLEITPRESDARLSSRQPPGWVDVFTPGTEERVGPVLKTLAALGDPRAVPALRWVLEREVLPQDTGFVLASMGGGAAELIPAMVRWLRDLPVVHDWDMSREGLFVALGRLGPAAVPALSDLVILLGDERIASSAARTLGQIGPLAAPAIPALRGLLDHADGSIGIAAARALYSITSDAASTLPTLKRHLVDASKSNIEAVDGLAELGSAAVACAPQLRALLTDPLAIVRVRAAAALWAIAADVEASLQVLLADWDGSPHIRLDAARCIASMGSAARSAIPVLQGELARVRRHTYMPNGSGGHDIVDDEALLEECAVALTRITGEGPIARGR